MTDLERAARLAAELKERLRPFVGRPLNEALRGEIMTEVKAWVAEKEAELGLKSEALRQVTLSVITSLLPKGCGPGE